MRVLKDWYGAMGNITIGKAYDVEEDCSGIWFKDDEGVLRSGHLADWEEDTTEEHTGGSSSYYDIDVRGSEVRCLDIIEKLQMTFSEGNAFKAIWRTAAARQGKKKAGNNAVYDAEKVCFFGERMLVAAKGKKE